LFKDDEFHFLAIEFKLKSGRHTIEIWLARFFVVNDNLPNDLLNP
jgi:hypothetical protein